MTREAAQKPKTSVARAREKDAQQPSRAPEPDVVMARRANQRATNKHPALPLSGTVHVKDTYKVKHGAWCLVSALDETNLGATGSVSVKWDAGDAGTTWKFEAPTSVTTDEGGYLKAYVKAATPGAKVCPVSVTVNTDDGVLVTKNLSVAVDVLPDKAEPANDQAEETESGYHLSASGVDQAYEDVAAAADSVVGKREIAVDSFVARMKNEDRDGLNEAAMKVAAAAALGTVSGALGERFAKAIDGEFGPEKVMGNAVKDAFKEAGKAAGAAVLGAAFSDPHLNIDAYSEVQRRGLVADREALKRTVATAKAASKRPLDAAQLETSKRHFAKDGVRAAERTKRAFSSLDPELSQYASTLSEWMTLSARKALGTASAGGVDMEDAVDIEPRDHTQLRGRAAEDGVAYIALGSREPIRPMRVGSDQLKLAGITSSALARIRKLKLRDLSVPIVVSGYLHTGGLDGAYMFNNAVAFGMSETGHAWWNGDEDGLDVLQAVTNKPTLADAIYDVIENDLKDTPLTDAKSVSGTGPLGKVTK